MWKGSRSSSSSSSNFRSSRGIAEIKSCISTLQPCSDFGRGLVLICLLSEVILIPSGVSLCIAYTSTVRVTLQILKIQYIVCLAFTLHIEMLNLLPVERFDFYTSLLSRCTHPRQHVLHMGLLGRQSETVRKRQMQFI